MFFVVVLLVLYQGKKEITFITLSLKRAQNETFMKQLFNMTFVHMKEIPLPAIP